MELLPRKVWEHQSPELTNMGKFRAWLEEKSGYQFNGFEQLYNYSIKNRAEFWDYCWKYFQPIHEGTYSTVVDETAPIESIPSWFRGVKINYCENMLLSHPGNQGKENEKIAVTKISEGKLDGAQHWTWGELRERVGTLSQAMKAHGIAKGDRVAVCAGNNMETLTVFLATTAVGAIFCSSSTDIGVEGLLDRLLQVKPRVLFMDDWTVYNGKSIDLREKIAKFATAMGNIAEFNWIVSQSPYPSQPGELTGIPKSQTLAAFLSKAPNCDLEFERVEFRDPAMIAFSSGTTGQPKCIVHSVGGLLVNAYKESGLHLECTPESVTLQYTTTGWIMYLFAIQPLLLGSRIILYDGSPLTPDATALIQIVHMYRATHLGVSPRYFSELRNQRIVPKDLAKLDHLKIVSSTGMILSDDLFTWFYDEAFPPHVQLSNISGGTEIAGCFTISNSLSPVYVGGCSGRSLGIPVAAYKEDMQWKHGLKGIPVADGSPGELVATAAFPNMPVAFWGPDAKQRYFSAYFSRFPNVWNHGDFVIVHPTTKQFVFLGRADGVLNPSGIRFGSAEIYRLIERSFSNEVADSLCVGQKRPQDSDERVFLFLQTRPEIPFSESLVKSVKLAIKTKLSPRHVPAFIFETPEIPMTVNMKKVELPVKHIISGKIIKPSGTLKNPKSLQYYYQFAEVEKLMPNKALL